MTLNHRDSETSTLTYNTDTPITTYNIEPASDEAKTETPTITYNTEPTSDEIKETLLGRFWRHSRNIAAGLLFAMGTQALLTGCSPENEPIPNNQTEININVFNNGANIDISNSPGVKIEGNTLKVGYNTMAQWPENIPSNDVKIIVSPSKYFTSTTEITSGSTLSQDLKGQYLGVKVKEKKALIGELVDKVEEKINTLQNLNYKVDEPVDLTLGGTLNIVEASFELNGETTNLNTSSAIFPRPGTGTLNVKYQNTNGNTRDYSFNINVKPLEYNEVTLDKFNISDRYTRYINISNGTKEFYEPHLYIATLAGDFYKCPEKKHIIARETYKGANENNIGSSTYDEHGNTSYRCTASLSPHTTVLGGNCSLREILTYVQERPNEKFMISCSVPSTTTTQSDLTQDKDRAVVKSLSKMKNVSFFSAVHNKQSNSTDVRRTVNNQNTPNGNNYINCNYYNTSSINGELYPVYSVSGYNTRNHQNNFYSKLNDGSANSGLNSNMPVEYNFAENNIVLVAPGGIATDNSEICSTKSSYPTAVIASIYGNYCEILMSKYNISLAEASKRIANNYLTKQQYQYVDENGKFANGWYRYFIDGDKFYENEILEIDKINNIQFDSDIVELPNSKGCLYEGMGVFVKIDGVSYETTETNKSKLEQAIRLGKIERQYWKKETFEKHGGTDTLTLTALGVSKEGKGFSKQKTITKRVS